MREYGRYHTSVKVIVRANCIYTVYLNPNTNPIVSPELLAPTADCRVPLQQLSHGNLVVLLNRGTGSCRSYLVKLLTVGCHLGLNRRGRLDTVAGLGRGATDDTDADVIQPKGLCS